MAQQLIDLRRFAAGEDLARAAAEEFTRRAEAAIRDHARFSVVLSGGSTPRRLYRLLADPAQPFRDRIDWSATHVFWGDERHVPPDHPDSNYRMAREALLDLVPVPADNIHRMRGEESDAARAASLYEAELRAFFYDTPEQPRFDLVLLGLGADAHTASLFPGSEAVRERERWVVAPWVEKLASWRITLTPAVFDRAAAVIFLVQGEDKADALRAVLEGDLEGDLEGALEGERDPDRYPAQVVRPESGELLWLVDDAAANRLRR